MVTIFNNTDYLFTPAEQQEIRNAATYAGLDGLYVQRESTKPEDGNFFHFYEDEDFSVYAFSMDVEGNVIYDRRN